MRVWVRAQRAYRPPEPRGLGPVRGLFEEQWELLLSDPHVPGQGLWRHATPSRLRQGAAAVAPPVA